MSSFRFIFICFCLVLISSCAVTNVDKVAEDNFSLNLSKQGLTEIPSDVFSKKHLKVLKLFGNNLAEISSRIGELDQLEELYIGKNNLSFLPPEIGKLKKLKILSVQYNKLQTLPAEIGDLENLEQLWLNQNQLKALPPEIGKLKKLVKLQIEFNSLTKLPSEIGNCESLGFIFLLSSFSLRNSEQKIILE